MNINNDMETVMVVTFAFQLGSLVLMIAILCWVVVGVFLGYKSGSGGPQSFTNEHPCLLPVILIVLAAGCLLLHFLHMKIFPFRKT